MRALADASRQFESILDMSEFSIQFFSHTGARTPISPLHGGLQ
jgi:hypothetical protein